MAFSTEKARAFLGSDELPRSPVRCAALLGGALARITELESAVQQVGRVFDAHLGASWRKDAPKDSGDVALIELLSLVPQAPPKDEQKRIR